MTSEHEELLAVLQEAIESKRVLFFLYNGEMRRVQPYCCGVSTAGNEVLRGFQDGLFSSGNNEDFKLFNLAKISEVRILEDTFTGKHPDYNPNDKQMREIYFHI